MSSDAGDVVMEEKVETITITTITDAPAPAAEEKKEEPSGEKEETPSEKKDKPSDEKSADSAPMEKTEGGGEGADEEGGKAEEAPPASAEKKERKPRAKRPPPESPSTPIDTGRPKREKKAVQLFSATSFDKEKSSEPLVIQKGKGQRLRDLENVEHRLGLTRTTAPSLILLHRVLFPSHKAHPVKSVIKGHIRDFSGWTEAGDEDEARKRLEKREVKALRQLCDLLDVPSAGSKKDVIEHIVAFCLTPTASGHAFKSKKAKGKRGSGGGKGSGKKGKKKGGGGMNAYMLFVKDKREGGEGEGMSVAEFGKKMGEEWRALDDDEKEKYKEQAQALKGEGGGDDEEGDDDEEGEDEDEGEGEEEGEDEEGDGEADGGDADKKANGGKKSSKDDDDEDESSLTDEAKTTLEKLRESIANVLKGANLESLSVKGVKEQLTLEHGEEVISKFAAKIKNIVIKAVQGGQQE